MKEFQTEMHDIVKTVKFRKPKYNSLQTKLKEDIRKLRNDEKVYVAADKTSDYYKLTPERCAELLNNNITKEYKKTKKNVIDKINKDDKNLRKNLKLIIDSFLNNPKCRIINPSKPKLIKLASKS